ncbi:uncharacterized protein LOC121371730 [Gigantopelta aegis]|uniref:uncharacterized protein LOC121371730 n=1 Tax=Gigantopelta aegis TaxID=1735272 RepID=UPI001B889E7C|nr:uncharacterized protein LOC121371730 [Gigantopelta aegis]
MTKCSFGKCKRNPTVKTEDGRRPGRYLCGCLANVVIIILVAFGVAAFNLRSYTSSSDFYNFHKGDQISIKETEADDFSTILCKKYRVEPWTKANVYLLHSKAKVDKHHKKEVRKQLAHGTFNADNSYNYDGFYLLKHSEIFVNACRITSELPDMDVEMNVMLFKGRESWKTWQEDQECRDCPIMTLTLTDRDTCSVGSGGVGSRTMKYKVHHTGSYYVAVARKYKRDLHKPVSLNVDVLVERTTYKLDRIKEFCPDTRYCLLNLTYASKEDVVVEMNDDRFATDAFFSTHCHLRVMFWVGIFGVLPAMLILIAVSCCCCCIACGKSDDAKPGKDKAQPINYSDKATLVINEQLPGQQLPQQQLPSYESVVNDKLQIV